MEGQESKRSIGFDEALEAFEGALSSFVGQISDDLYGKAFTGKSKGGEGFEITLHQCGEYISAGVMFAERGVSTPCETMDELKKALGECIAYAQPKRKKQEQLTLW